MSGRLSFKFVLVLGFLLLVLAPGARSQTPPPWMPCSGINRVDQRFPVAGAEETHWILCWETANAQGLVIHWAFFRKAPTAPWIRIFWDARVSEIFVPYHPGGPRFFDMSGFNFPVTSIGVRDCPAASGGTVLGGVVCKEVRDRGLAWKDDAQVRRGQELVLWAAMDAVNYNYVIEYTFRDDGVVLGRVGATARNLPGAEWVTHVHVPIWRLDIDFNGSGGDSVALGTHTEFVPGPLQATDTAPVILKETGIDWNPQAFHQLEISDSVLVNSRGHRSSLQLIALPTGGLSRHDEVFTKKDFWVTPYDPSQMRARDLPSYVAQNRNVANTDIVVWYKGSVHHHPRDEDGEIVQGGLRGEALVMWTGWMLKPHDLFDRTPLFP